MCRSVDAARPAAAAACRGLRRGRRRQVARREPRRARRRRRRRWRWWRRRATAVGVRVGTCASSREVVRRPARRGGRRRWRRGDGRCAASGRARVRARRALMALLEQLGLRSGAIGGSTPVSSPAAPAAHTSAAHDRGGLRAHDARRRQPRRRRSPSARAARAPRAARPTRQQPAARHGLRGRGERVERDQQDAAGARAQRRAAPAPCQLTFSAAGDVQRDGLKLAVVGVAGRRCVGASVGGRDERVEDRLASAADLARWRGR